MLMLTSVLWSLAAAAPPWPPRPPGVPADSCYGAGVWTPAGTYGPHEDGCNRGLCELGAWTSVTLLSCEIQIAEQVYFAPGSAALPADSGPLCDALGELLTRHPELRVAVRGHATAAEHGRDPSLGRRRAEAVLAALVARGVPPDHLVTADAGATMPITAPGAGDEARNRRADFEVLPRAAGE